MKASNKHPKELMVEAVSEVKRRGGSFVTLSLVDAQRVMEALPASDIKEDKEQGEWPKNNYGPYQSFNPNLDFTHD